MKALFYLVRRNCKIYFKDKGLFFTSLITPIILLVLYLTFLAGVYRENFVSVFPDDIQISGLLVDCFVGGQLTSSILAVSCVTVSFCSNSLMVADKVTGAGNDLAVTPVKSSQLSLGYYISSVISSLIVCFVAMGFCFFYLSKVGGLFSAGDVFLTAIDIFLLVLFGTGISSVINLFLKTQGQISAVGTVVSAGYGFICGAYMPISQFSPALQKALSFLPGTYGTSLIRNHMMNGVFDEMANQKFPQEIIDGIKNSVDCRMFFFASQVTIEKMYLILCFSVAALILIYIAISAAKKKN